MSAAGTSSDTAGRLSAHPPGAILRRFGASGLHYWTSPHPLTRQAIRLTYSGVTLAILMFKQTRHMVKLSKK
jgi:hypothetical protein